MSGITALDVENFRCFKRLRIDGLSPVTVFVGANNAGKTTVLEAIEAVVSVDSPFLLYRASFERGESRVAEHGTTAQLDLRHWFYGHRLESGTSFSLRAEGADPRA